MIISQFSYLHLNLPKTNFHPSFTTLSPITRVTHHKSIPALSESHIAIPLEKKKEKREKQHTRNTWKHCMRDIPFSSSRMKAYRTGKVRSLEQRSTRSSKEEKVNSARLQLGTHCWQICAGKYRVEIESWMREKNKKRRKNSGFNLIIRKQRRTTPNKQLFILSTALPLTGSVNI